MAKKAVKRGAKPVAKPVAKKAPTRRGANGGANKRALVDIVVGGRPTVHYATLYLFGTGAEVTVGSVTPERLSVRVGDLVDWTIVDATGAKIDPKRVTIRWKGERSPLAKEARFEGRAARSPIRRGSKGTYRYSLVLDERELFDPEVEVMN